MLVHLPTPQLLTLKQSELPLDQLQPSHNHLHNIELNLDLPFVYNLTHIHRKEMLRNNWQLNEDQIPMFIKYGYVWRFNGIPKDQRTQLMSQVWTGVGGEYV